MTEVEHIKPDARFHDNGDNDNDNDNENDQPAAKRTKLDNEPAAPPPERIKGMASIKKEFLIEVNRESNRSTDAADDDDAEAAGKADPGGQHQQQQQQRNGGGKRGKKGKAKGGQNTGRQFGASHDKIKFCDNLAQANEFDLEACPNGKECRFGHDLRLYLSEGKRKDLETLEGVCPIFKSRGRCKAGWKCRFVGSHSKEVEREDGRRELVLVTNDLNGHTVEDFEANGIEIEDKRRLKRREVPTPKADGYMKWLELCTEQEHKPRRPSVDSDGIPIQWPDEQEDNRARYREAALRPSEKRRIYYGPETPVLAPLTTQGNLPFRRLCVALGAEITWSEMAESDELLKGETRDWTLLKAHQSELTPPKYSPKHTVLGYDNSIDLKFGAQIAANKPALATRTTEILTTFCPRLRAIDLNCGCPVETVFSKGAGSALMDTQTKMTKLLRGMNAVSGEVPITVKIRMGVKDNHPTADKLCQRLVLGDENAPEGLETPAGVAAITLHGRSRQQRYTRSADWEYIASCANLVRDLKAKQGDVTDTIREPEARDLPVTNGAAGPGLPYFIGNGDILSHEDWNAHIGHANVDSCMIGRGALVKPWVFEEISAGQYLDKRGSERWELVEQFVRNGLHHWGSDEFGVGMTRRFLLEWLSFHCRYVPVGILEHLPPRMGDRPPAFRGRDDKETLLSSGNYKDWIKISECFLGPVHKDFKFEPKHKSNSYEIETQG